MALIRVFRLQKYLLDIIIHRDKKLVVQTEGCLHLSANLSLNPSLTPLVQTTPLLPPLPSPLFQILIGLLILSLSSPPPFPPPPFSFALFLCSTIFTPFSPVSCGRLVDPDIGESHHSEGPVEGDLNKNSFYAGEMTTSFSVDFAMYEVR